MASMLGGGYVNYFSLDGRSYKVIPQVQQASRLNPDQLLSYYIHTPSGASVPLSTVATLQTKTVPESLNHFQQLNSATLQGVAGAPMGQVIAMPSRKSRPRSCRPGYSIDFGGEARQLVQESGGFLPTLMFALIIIFPRARRAVRKLPRSAGDPRLGAIVPHRGADLYHARRRQQRHGPGRHEPQHLHPGGPGNADGPDQQARHPDRRVRERNPAPGQDQAGGGGACDRRSGCARF